MCGICGAVALCCKAIDSLKAKPMTDSIAHRGPDDSGFLFYHTGCRHDSKISFFQSATESQFAHLSPLLPRIEDPAVINELKAHDWDLFLGHRRLSIIDPTPAGHQPMSDLSKNIWVIYNGEIYNFRELRAELQKRGHQFRTRSDTEVLIYAYIEWGTEAITKFNGMFALAIYDNFRKTVLLARDRFGIKPLYYAEIGGQLVFASEQKAILSYASQSFRFDYEALLEYFTFQNIFTNRTFFREIKTFPPGHFARVDLSTANEGKSNINLSKYWDYQFREPDNPADPSEYSEELDRLLRQAVRRQLVSDVELGSYLSGGMDSGTLTALAAQELPYIKTFTCGFDLSSASGIELAFDERAKAEAMSARFKTEHYEMVLKAGDMERILPKVSWHIEEPRVGQSYPNYYAAQLASKFVKVVISGTGGDELFGGYPWRYYKAMVNNNFEEYIDKYYVYWQRLVDNQHIKAIFSPVWERVKHIRTRDIFRDVFMKHEHNLRTPADYINHSLYLEAKTFLHGLLIIEDKLSMAHGLETRVPFLDNDLVDFAMKIPISLKLKNFTEEARINENDPRPKNSVYFQRYKDGKLLLRKVMGRYIPPEITEGDKQGFSAPDASWFKGESMEYVRRFILNSNSKIFEHLDRAAVTEIVEEHLQGKVNRRLFIWSLLNVEWWLRQNQIVTD
jgi:asparagine synthase (glutamine-hydrolysing)